ncbi:Ribokinase-like protein [Dimargaris cristalligena]|uniref:Ribokinase-like protein n=1 Tax=Dimargaris cristalligena TaxID=215637 RepID=A0A4P9ZQY9_9FUNG|nr:Ribokinase-like protein [Dimargaris cristalligena]|eukprot:RKP35797.1 Ribokinase-like protein [Dimargaris cristalligena]
MTDTTPSAPSPPRTSILCYGSINIDEVYQVDGIAQPGQTIPTYGRTVSAGGKGANQAVAAGRTGSPVYMAGRIGTDGEWLRTRLENSGVDTRHVRTDTNPTSRAIIQVCRKTGENAIILFGSTGFGVDPADITRVLSKFGPRDMLMIQNELAQVDIILAQARERGLCIVYNPAPMDPILWQRIDRQAIDILIVNENEAETLPTIITITFLGRIVGGDHCGGNPIHARGADGGGGADADTGTVAQPVVDTTGAGDTWIGYFVGLLVKQLNSLLPSTEDHPTEPRAEGPFVNLDAEIMRGILGQASVAAGLAVTRPGAMDSIPTLAEVEQHNRTQYF